MFKEKIIIEMKEVFKEIPFGIEHTLKVLKNAEDIMKGENIGEEEKEFISIIAILHDIGAVEAQKKYGSIDGVYQEKEGPEVAKEILKKVGYNKNIDRICFIIGNHHTPSKIDGLDFQIQWEADLLENLTVIDKEKEQEKIKKCIDENFKTTATTLSIFHTSVKYSLDFVACVFCIPLIHNLLPPSYNERKRPKNTGRSTHFFYFLFIFFFPVFKFILIDDLQSVTCFQSFLFKILFFLFLFGRGTKPAR